MADKLMYIQNDDTQNYPFCRLQLVADTFVHLTLWYNQNSIKVPNVFESSNNLSNSQSVVGFFEIFSEIHMFFVEKIIIS